MDEMNISGMSTFWKNRKVLVTGHTGFKGTWLCAVLTWYGANVIGYALDFPTSPSLFELTNMGSMIQSYKGDIRDLVKLKEIFTNEQPEIVIHMAAQPIVRESYLNPVATYETNVVGTVNVLECCRLTSSVKSIVNVTTDKVYLNREWDKGYVETDLLDGYDPYSNSKSCSELVTHSYARCFLHERGIAVSTCRAGNVIGGGDFAKDRIIPDCVRAAVSQEKLIVVRNPYSTRPYQHVLEPLFVYLRIAMEQYKNPKYADCYNIGPDDENCMTTGELVTMFCETWNQTLQNSDSNAEPVCWKSHCDGGPHEAHFLKLDCTRLKTIFEWTPKWSMNEVLTKIVQFEQLRIGGADADKLLHCMKEQIENYQ